MKCLSESPYASPKKQRLRHNKKIKKAILDLASRQEKPTLVEVKQLLQCDDAKAKLVFTSIKTKRKQLAKALNVSESEIKLPKIQPDDGSGFIYLVINPKFKNWVKCGMTTNPSSRLRSYNGYDPLSEFKYLDIKKVEFRRKAESALKKILTCHSKHFNGEWFNIEEKTSLDLFSTIA